MSKDLSCYLSIFDQRWTRQSLLVNPGKEFPNGNN